MQLGSFTKSYKIQLEYFQDYLTESTQLSSPIAYSCNAAIWVRYLPVISLGSGVVPGHGTWPSTSQMHSLKQYFLGPKLAGLDACIFAWASVCNISLQSRQEQILLYLIWSIRNVHFGADCKYVIWIPCTLICSRSCTTVIFKLTKCIFCFVF